MKRLTSIAPCLTLLALLFPTPVTAGEIIMVCTHPDVNWDYTVKYVEKFYASPKVYIRRERGWDDWSKRHNGWVKEEYEVGDRTLYMESYRDDEAKEDYEGENLRKGDKYRLWSITKADFEFLKFNVKRWITKVHSSPLGKDKVFSRNDSKVKRFTCKNHELKKPVK